MLTRIQIGIYFLILLISQGVGKCPYGQGWKRNQMKLGKGQILTLTRYNFWMIVDENDSYGSVLTRNDGLKEPQLVYLAMKSVKKGDVILNVGSQTGMQALAMAKIIGPTGKIFVFEPYSVSYKIMRKNMYLNGFGPISTTYNMAATNVNGVGKLKIPGTHTGWNHVKNVNEVMPGNPKSGVTKLGQNNFEQQILLGRIEDILPEDVQVDMLFMDTEAHQMHVLDGMKKVIQRSPNLIIIAEWKSIQQYPNRQLFEKTVSYLLEKGYKIYDILPDQSTLVMLECYYPQLVLKETLDSLIFTSTYSSNVIMLPPGKQLPKY